MVRDVVVIGGSAGALQPLIGLVKSLPRSLEASLFVVVHTSPETPGALPSLLQTGSSPTAAYATDGEPFRRGHVHLARPDHHFLLDDGHVRVVHGPRENGFRPAIDPLFRTAARRYGSRVIGIILSGALDDGTNGLALIKRHGGIAMVQHPEDAMVDGMPLSALRNVEVDHVVPSTDLAALVLRHVGELDAKAASAMRTRASQPPDSAEGRAHGLEDGSLDGPPSGFVCPECNGALWELHDGSILRFVCHVGHSYSTQTLLTGKAAQLEPVLWTALRALEESAAVLRRVAERSAAKRLKAIAAGYRAKADDTERRANVLREILLQEPVPLPESKASTDAAPASRRTTPSRRRRSPSRARGDRDRVDREMEFRK